MPIYKYKQNALNIVDQLIGYNTGKEDALTLEVLRDLREIIELHWGEAKG